MVPKNNNQKGFALLITLLVLGVVIAIGLSVLELSQKQVRLSSNSADSETAFHAANGGIECARYWRRVEASDFENGNNVNEDCFGDNDTFTAGTVPVTTSGGGTSYFYKAQYDWGSLNRCSVIEMLVINVPPTASSDHVVSNMTNLFPGYPDPSGTNEKICTPGGLCTVAVSYGFSKPCSLKDKIGTVQREVLVQF